MPKTRTVDPDPTDDPREPAWVLSVRKRTQLRVWMIALAVFFGALIIANPTITAPGRAPSAIWFFLAAVLAALTTIYLRCHAFLAAAIGASCLTAGWTSARLHTPSDLDLNRAVVGSAWSVPDPAATPPLIRIEGVVTEAAQTSEPAEGLDRFLVATDRARFTLLADQLIGDNASRRVRSTLRISVPETEVPEFKIGDHLRVTGLYRPPTGPMNPGENDRRVYAMQESHSGSLVVSSADLIERLEPDRSLDNRLRVLRARARAWAEGVIGNEENTEARQLVTAMTLGVRERSMDDTADRFVRTGIAHLLAVSGFHLAVLVWLTLGISRLTGDHGRIGACVALAIIIAYALLVPAKAPIVRAAALSSSLVIAEVLGRRWDRLTVLGWILIALVVWRPADTMGLGLPLSVGVTAMLIHISGNRLPIVFVRAPVRGIIQKQSFVSALARSLRSYTMVCVLAWLASVPLVWMQTGIVSPVGPIAAMIATPLATATLALGFASLLVSLVLPGVGAVLSSGASWIAGLMNGTVRTLESIPLGAIETTGPGWIWAALATICFIAILANRGSNHLRVVALTAIPMVWALLAILIRPPLPISTAARIDMLSVGNGSCLIVRTGSEVLIWDFGSLRPGMAERVVPDALRSLGIERTPSAVLTHANIDHYNGLPILVDQQGLQRLLISAPALERMREQTGGPEPAFLQSMADAGVRIEGVAAGDSIHMGDAELRIVWPPNNQTDARGRLRSDNDLSLVAILEIPTRAGPRRMLLTGDIQPAAIAEILLMIESGDVPRVDALELPHHGSWNSAAMDLVRESGASSVLQSTGSERAGDGRWRAAIGAVVEDGGTWAITARDGAAWVEIHKDGSVRSGSMRDGW